MKPLLAKSITPSGKGIDLREHTAMVLSALDALLSICGTASLEAMGYGAEVLPELSKMAKLAAFVHDLGKCSDHFQGMVAKTRQEPQLIRHEALSLWLCWPGQPLYEWLRPAVDSDAAYQMAIVAAAGHHCKFLKGTFAPTNNGAGTSLELWVHHSGFLDVLKLGQKTLGLGEPPMFTKPISINADLSLEDMFEPWEINYDEILLEGEPGEREKLAALCKVLVLCADVAGSALHGEAAPKHWISEMLPKRPGQEDLKLLIERKLEGKPLRTFQKELSQSKASVTLALAGCGTGKTLAAYLWAQQQYPHKKLWMTYPTTGTATEGFRDYLHGVDEIESRLEHGRASVDVEIFGLLGDSDSQREQDRLDALRIWGKEVVSCTVDTVLGLLQNHRKGMYAWPSLCDSAIVFDEIHAYDERLFASLLRFLITLPGIPALLMTASLPQDRLRKLEQAIVQRGRGAMTTVQGPADLQSLPRYIQLSGEDPWALVTKTLQENGKVLWISNTVDRCRSAADEAIERGLSPLVYHSRFKYIDRVERHGEVIKAFQERGPALAMTTQVAEMSLDLSADLLVMDLAPVPSMIQRMGRLNRRSTPEKPSAPKPFWVLPVHDKPYEEADLQAGFRFLQTLGTAGPLSQNDLQDAWMPSKEQKQGEEVRFAWLDGGFQSNPSHLREGEFGVNVLLAEDLPKVKEQKSELSKLVVPMNNAPKGIKVAQWPTHQFYPVAPAECIDYDSKRGARWRSQAKARH